MKQYILLLCLAVLSSCRPDEKELPTVSFQQQLVINSRIGPDERLYVAISRTLPPDQLGDNPGSEAWFEKVMVDTLQVVLEYGQTKVTLIPEGKGIYAADISSMLHRDYGHIMVYNSHGKLLLESYTRSQEEPKVTLWEPKATVRATDTLCSIKLRIEETSKEDCWYLVGFSRWSEDLALIQQRKMTLTRLLSDRSLRDQRAFLVSSEQMQNGVLELEKNLPWLNANDTLLVNVSRLDKDYYRYLKEQLKAGNWLNQLMGESINLKGNVLGGLGYFTLHRSRNKFYLMKDYIQ
ncbi:MAG: DUF4249 family protein [Bacteroidetes bacterium]|nr:MAG: DUF4249 family protein [Bacteroidota bacterium]